MNCRNCGGYVYFSDDVLRTSVKLASLVDDERAVKYAKRDDYVTGSCNQCSRKHWARLESSTSGGTVIDKGDKKVWRPD